MADETYRRFPSGRYPEEKDYYKKLEEIHKDPNKSEVRKQAEGLVEAGKEVMRQLDVFGVKRRSKKELGKMGEE